MLSYVSFSWVRLARVSLCCVCTLHYKLEGGYFSLREVILARFSRFASVTIKFEGASRSFCTSATRDYCAPPNAKTEGTPTRISPAVQ